MTISPIVSSSGNTRLRSLTATVFLLDVAMILWLPFGFNISCWADGWITFSDVAKGNIVLWGASRPFLFVVNWLGYTLTPNSFIGTNLVLLILFFLTGLLIYLILHQLEVPLVAALAAGALAIIYPADNIAFYLGAIAIHFAVVCYLLGVYLLVTFQRTKRWWLVPLVWFTLALSVGTYEVGYPLILLTPIALLLLRPSLRQLLIASVIWYFVPVLNLAHLYILSRQDPSQLNYQSGLLANTPSVAEMLQSLLNAYKITLYTGWSVSQGISPAITTKTDLALGLIVGVIVVSMLIWLTTRATQTPRLFSNRRNMVILGLGSLAAIGLGFAPYLPTALRDSASRTLYYSSVGAAVCIMVALWLFTSVMPLKRLFFPLLIGILVGLGTVRLLDQHAASIAVPNEQNEVLLDTLKHIPDIRSGSTVIVIDDTSDKYLSTIFFSSAYFEPGVQLVLRDFSVRAGICYPNLATPWGGAFQESCTFENDRSVISEFQQPFLQSDYSHLVVLRFTVDHQIEVQSDLSAYVQNSAALNAYQPDKLIDVTGSLPAAAYTLLPVVSLPN